MTDRALVVGASSEIGRAIAVGFAQWRGHLVLWGRDARRLGATAAACRDAGAAGVEEMTVDVSDDAALRRHAPQRRKGP